MKFFYQIKTNTTFTSLQQPPFIIPPLYLPPLINPPPSSIYQLSIQYVCLPENNQIQHQQQSWWVCAPLVYTQRSKILAWSAVRVCEQIGQWIWNTRKENTFRGDKNLIKMTMINPFLFYYDTNNWIAKEIKYTFYVTWQFLTQIEAIETSRPFKTRGRPTDRQTDQAIGKFHCQLI